MEMTAKPRRSFDVFDEDSWRQLAEEWADMIMEGKLTYEHKFNIEVTVRNNMALPPAHLARGVTEVLSRYFLNVDRNWEKEAEVGEIYTRSLRLPTDEIDRKELAAYHVQATKVFGGGAIATPARRAHRKAVLGKNIVASKMTLEEYEKVMAALQEAHNL